MHEEDRSEFTKHAARETLITQYRLTFGLSHREALEDFVSHAENDPDSPVFTIASGKPRKRPRKQHAETHA